MSLAAYEQLQFQAVRQMIVLQGALRAIGQMMGEMHPDATLDPGDMRNLMTVVEGQALAVENAYREAAQSLG
jgi:hypothetical protein